MLLLADFRSIKPYIPLIIFLISGTTGVVVAKSNSSFSYQQVQQVVPSDTTKTDSLSNLPYSSSRRPTHNPKYRFGDPFSNSTSTSPLWLKDPSKLELDVEIDTSLNYTIYEKIGNLNYRPTSSMSFDEFNKFQDRKIMKSYWKSRSAGLDGESAVSGRNIIPPIYVSPLLDRIFGGSYVEIIPRGFVTLDFGARWQRTDNPGIPIRQQRNGGFEFDQQISMNVTGKIGEKLQVTANFDNNNSFDFENNLKVEFTGFEEDIIKKLEIGNISLPLNNTLISGAQNLFGIKAQMQFGKLFVTSVASTQRGKTQSIEVGGGAGGGQGRIFEIQAAEYDENRHFFLGHFFRDQYEAWLKNIPNVFSGVNIRRVEVYVLNRQNNTQTLRNIVGLMDLGEPGRIYNDGVTATAGISENDNDANSLFSLVSALDDRSEVRINETLENLSLLGGERLENGLDYEKLTGARKLDESEFSFNPLLGYISLNRKLQNDEALAVSYEYTFKGNNYQVGELSDDYSNIPEDEVIFMKLLRPRKINIRDEENVTIPTWDLMMKNIYYLNANQIEQSGFDLRVIYRDDETGNDQPSLQDGTNTPIIELLGLDKLNSSNDIQKDGNFDFVEGLTVDTDNGLVIFPFIEPFNTPLADQFKGRSDEDFLRTKYVYDTLYRTTRSNAQQVNEKNKYYITGSMESGSSSEINLPGFNIAEGSVKVFAGGIALVENQDYQVDYTFGKVRITNQGVLNSGKKITVNYETADLFNFQSRTLLGSRFDYKLNNGVNFGATVLYLNERPLISRISVGNEPARNLKYGFDINIQKESRMLTKLVDMMPIIQTKAPSNVSFSAEFAQLRPGTSNKINGESTSYLDDFEASVTPYNLGNPTNWKLAATPRTNDNRFNGDPISNDVLSVGYKRAKLAWYQVDNLFYRSGGANNPDLSDEQLDNHYSRAVSQQEIFPFRSQVVGNNNEPIFDLAYFPSERGPYNYSPDFNTVDGTLPNARGNWAGITQAVRTEVDFVKSNIEYIEFWMMDPFITGPFGEIDDGINGPSEVKSSGELIFNLGSVNEDVVKDGRHAFENGLPSDGLSLSVEENDWGRVTTQQYLTNAFDNSGDRANQDVGLDGLKDEDEGVHHIDFVGSGLEDVSADNFRYFLDYGQDANIVERYKNFNGHDGNSPISNNSSFTPSGSTRPDNEDLNGDNTLSELEEYYEYRISIDSSPGEMEVGKNNIVDQIVAEDPNGQGQDVTWFLFRVPIRQPDAKYGNINGFQSIRYIRTILTGFTEPTVLRLANFRMVGSQWRQYTKSLEGGAGSEDKETDLNNLTISVVNIEENSQGNATQPPYVLPPGFARDRDNTSSVERSLNEQSLQLCVENLEDNDARAAYKQLSLDLINYGRIKMFLHANSPEVLEDGDLKAFIRLGRGDDQNYYEIEVPLRVTPPGASLDTEIWPAQNEIDISFDELFQLKKERITDPNGSPQVIFPRNEGKAVGHHLIKVLGNPVINDVSQIMIGIRNVKSDDKTPITACIWANELRVTDFDSQAGWATNATFNAQLADLGSVTASTRYTSVGFGSVQSKISERSREETTTYDLATNLNLDKFLPEKAGLKIPMYASYEKTNIKPNWDPASPDLTVAESLVLIEDDEERGNYELQVQDNTVRRSINFTNVQKVKTNPEAKKHIYDIENFTFTYAYSDVTRRNYSISEYLKQNYKGAMGYTFSPEYDGWSPFGETSSLKSPYLKWIKEFNVNPVPNNISIRADLDRQFIKTVYRNREGAQPNYEKFFNFNRTYNVRWNITQGLSLDYNARAHAVIDEPEGEINSDEKRDVIWDNIKNLGRLRDFNQDISANYKLPLDKLPFTNWVNADYRYTAGYTWTAATFIPDAGTDTQDLDLNFGGIIENNRGQALTGKFDMVKLYNKIKILKEVNTPPRRTRTNSRSQAADTVKSINDYKFAKGFLRTLMMLRSINATYSLDEGTLLPGFSPTPFLFGMDSSFNAPGVPFILGSQNANIRKEASDNGWIVNNPLLTTPFSQSRSVNLSLKANIEPFKDFKIQIDAVKRKTSTYQELYRFDQDDNEFTSNSPGRSGSYSISFFTLKTAFSKDDDNNNSPTFQEFENNRTTILNRLNGLNTNSGSYDTNSQDVLIPAFLAAYTGTSVDKVKLSPFPKTPIPNWRFDYSGLSKIPALKDIFSSVSITHSYKSSYTVSNYINSIEYGDSDNIDFNNNVEDYNTTNFATQHNDGDIYIPKYIIGQVLISEQFSPLIGVNLRTKGRATIKVEYKKQRDLSLQLSNNQITELRSNDLVLEYGFTKANFKLPFKSQGRIITLKNDLQFRMSFTIRDTETIQRKIEDVNTITSGNINFQLRPNINYVLNKKLNLQFYFERSINEPKISTNPKRTTTSFGFQLRFSLAQ